MSQTETETATTAHGEVEYPVVVCGSCGQELLKADAHRVLITQHEVKEKFNEYRVPSGRKQWCCGHCLSDPVGWSVERSLRAYLLEDDESLISAIAGGIIGLIIGILGTVLLHGLLAMVLPA